MNIRPEIRKQIVWILGLLILASFTFLLFHHHPDGDHNQHCLICRLVQLITLIFVPLVALLAPLVNRTFSAVPVKKLISSFIPDHHQERAPPQV